jgi:peptidoglycan/LPS O-acetylase OafA/YrhL
MIFLSHYTINGQVIFNAGGTLGVSYFLILSGFVMTLGYYDKVMAPDFNYKLFMMKRLSRLWPLHLLCLFLFILLRGQISFTITYIAKLILNVFMLQSWIPYNRVYFSFNAVSWFLTLMVFFYAVFPFIARKMHEFKREWVILAYLIWVFLYISLQGLIPEAWEHPFLYISPLSRLMDFLLGMVLCLSVQSIHIGLKDKIKRLSYHKKSIIEIACVLMLLCMALPADNHVKHGVYLASYYWFPMSCLILLFTLFNESGGVISRLLTNRFLVHCGDISFEFYMIHTLMMGIYLKYCPLVQFNPYLAMMVYVLLLLLASHVLNKYFEKPIAHAILKRYKR